MRRAWSAAAAALALTGCAGARVPAVGEPAPELGNASQELAYQQILSRFTSQREIYRGFDTQLFAAATYQAPSFLEARIRRRGIFQAQPAQVVEAYLEKEKAEREEVHEFFLGVHVNDRKYEDFDRPDSIWRLALVSEGAEVTPIKVERVGRSNLNMRALYPYMGDFWVAYVVRFPRVLVNGLPAVPPGAKKVTLRLASSLGQADLEFPVD